VYLFPLPEPPAAEVAAVLEDLRYCRREQADAGRIVHMLNVDDEPGDGQTRRRLAVEQRVAERRCELWAAEVAAVEQRAAALGLDVRSTL
jgi:hypothetical protein